MLLSYAAGAAIATKNLGLPSKHIVFLGNGEEQEGNVSEAARHISSLDLDNLFCIVDNNQKQLSRPSGDVDGRANLAAIWRGYGWEVREIGNGHDISEILGAYSMGFRREASSASDRKHRKGKRFGRLRRTHSGFHTIGSCKNKSIVLDAFSEHKPGADIEEYKKICTNLKKKPFR
jgi:transketolase